MHIIDKSKPKWQDKILKVSSKLRISLTIPEAEKIGFITSNKWENLTNGLFYRKQIAYTMWVFFLLFNLPR